VVSAETEGLPAPEVVRTLESENGYTKAPVIVFSHKPLTKRTGTDLKRHTKTLKLKTAITPDQLQTELRAILQPPVVVLPQRAVARKLEAADLELLAGKKVLVVDDDVRNIFALTSLLERYKLDVIYAENGRNAISMLKTTPGIDIVLMDIMMPEMDGYDTMRAIRAIDRFQKLPIIALTARAMKGDREKCIEAGASDYIPKPVAPEQLLSQLCAWAKTMEPAVNA